MREHRRASTIAQSARACAALGLVVTVAYPRTATACSLAHVTMKGDVVSLMLDSPASAATAVSAYPALFQAGAASEIVLRPGAVDWSARAVPVCPALPATADAPAVPGLSVPILLVHRLKSQSPGIVPEPNGLTYVNASAGRIGNESVLHVGPSEIVTARTGDGWVFAIVQELPKPPSDTDGAWCERLKEQHDVEVICIDLFGRDRTILARPKRALLRPNVATLVAVQHSQGALVRAALDGESGYAPLDSAGTPAQPDAGTVKMAGVGRVVDADESEVSEFLFAARLPGRTTLRVQSFENGQARPDTPATTAPDKELELELYTERRYWGALRVGLGFALGDAASNTYELRGASAAPTSTTGPAQIALASEPTFNTDLVVGFAPYVLDVFFCGGRSHTTASVGQGCTFYLAPYLGFGVAGQTGDAVKAFTGLYLGAEWEFSPSFSIAAAYTLRRIQSLSDGLSVGSEVPIDSKYVTERTGRGFAIVVSFSPDFLQFARASSASAAGSTPAGSGR